MSTYVRLGAIALLIVAVTMLAGPSPVGAADSDDIDRDVNAALDALFDKTPEAKQLAAQAKGILGEGSLLVHGKPMAYYNIAAASYGLQAGVQSFGYAMLLMTDSAVNHLDKSGGWELGSGPSIVIADIGKAKTLTTTTIKDDVYAFIFDQKGLMAGAGLQGSKITKINR